MCIPFRNNFLVLDFTNGRHVVKIQGGAEPSDTFQMVIDNIWKQGKISETVYKFVQVCYLLTTDYKLIF